jgi:16S rRNA (adenine1518-N6/adenine1519-N6)-dimethyltransferase
LTPSASGKRSPRNSSFRRAPAPAALRELRKAGVFAKKSLGQHFLTDQRTLGRIAQAAVLSSDDCVIEIGAGLGDLTARLAERARRVIAIELDQPLVAHLRQRFAGTNVFVLEGDALKLDPADVLASAGENPPYVVAGNLPYYVAQPLLRHFLEAQPKPERLVVMVQAEVAESIAAKPGHLSILGVSVQLYGEAERLFRVPASAFYPPPKVESAVVRIDVTLELRARVDDVDAFFTIVRAGFGTKRKQLRNALATGLRVDPVVAGSVLSRAGIKHTLRAQELSLEQWAVLTKAWIALGRPGNKQ